MMIKSLLAPALLCFRSRKISPSTGVGFRLEAGFGIRGMSASVGSSKPVTGQNEVGKVKLLDAVNDNYGGVVVEMKLPMESAIFASLLRASLTQWRLQGKRGVWIKLPIEHVNLVEAAVKEGFWYHHAEPKYLMLAHWIPESPSTLPANASHRVGVGAVVMNEKKEGDNILQSSGQTWELNHGKAMEMAHLTKAADAVLVVQENSGILHGTGLWKFPTGVVNEGEDICAAAVREVKEETAIDTKFVEVLAFRQSHKSFFEKSDLFFVCQLEPLSSDIQKQDSEIEVAQWMPLEEYAANPLVKRHELLKYIVDICYAKMEKDYSGFSPVSVSSAFSGEKKNLLYLNHHDLNMH